MRRNRSKLAWGSPTATWRRNRRPDSGLPLQGWAPHSRPRARAAATRGGASPVEEGWGPEARAPVWRYSSTDVFYRAPWVNGFSYGGWAQSGKWHIKAALDRL